VDSGLAAVHNGVTGAYEPVIRGIRGRSPGSRSQGSRCKVVHR